MNVVLIMVRENGQRRSFAVTRDVTVIGRREDADFRIPLTDVSRKHCRLVKTGNALTLEDLGSSNGTLCNGERIKKTCTLRPGDAVRIGPVQFVIQIDGEPAEADVDTPRPARTASPVASGSVDTLMPAPPPAAPGFGRAAYDLSDDGDEATDERD